MKRIISIFISILFLALLLSNQVFAARERIRVRPSTKNPGGVSRTYYGGVQSLVKFRGDRQALFVTLSNTESVSSVSYELTYLASGVSQGVMGSIDPSIEPTASRELLFGTCSGGVCTYHQNLSNMRLTITSRLKSGLSVVKPYRIKI